MAADGERFSIGCDVQKNEIDILLAKGMTRGLGFFWRIHQSQTDDLGAHVFEPLRNLVHVACQTLMQSGELRPVRVESDSEQPHLEGVALQTVIHGLPRDCAAYRKSYAGRCDSTMNNIWR